MKKGEKTKEEEKVEEAKRLQAWQQDKQRKVSQSATEEQHRERSRKQSERKRQQKAEHEDRVVRSITNFASSTTSTPEEYVAALQEMLDPDQWDAHPDNPKNWPSNKRDE